ncbi:benzoylformate decarboxylase [Bartonella sp. LJL80]
MSNQIRCQQQERGYTVRDAVFDFFETIGVDTIFGNPGSTELPMFRNFPNHFRYILGLQEAIVIGMADGYAQATGRAAFVNLHSAAGVGNAMGNIFTAHKNHTPLVITAGQQARSILPYEPFLASVRPTELPQPYVKWAIEPARAEDVPLAMQRAYHIAMQEPKGPVLVSIPVDDWDRQALPLEQHEVSYEQRPDLAAIKNVSDALNSSAKPAFVVGGGVDRAKASEFVIALAEENEARVYVAPMTGRCSFPETHRLFGGFLPAMREKIVQILQGHDTIVVLGAAAFPYHVEGFGPHIPQGSKLFQIIEDPMTASWTPTGYGVVGNVRLALQDLLAMSQPISRTAPQPHSLPETIAASIPMTTPFVLQTLRSFDRSQWMIVEEAPGARAMIQTYLPIDLPGQFLTMESGGLGYGMPAAIGTALGMPDKRVIGIIGDGSAMYSIQSLWTAALLKLPITWCIFRNGSYAALKNFAPEFGFSSQEKVEGTDLPDLDFVTLARALGCRASRVTDPLKLQDELKAAIDHPTTTLIEIVLAD